MSSAPQIALGSACALFFGAVLALKQGHVLTALPNVVAGLGLSKWGWRRLGR